ncbi:hypothetical protein [Nocardia sp. NPDC004123]
MASRERFTVGAFGDHDLELSVRRLMSMASASLGHGTMGYVIVGNTVGQASIHTAAIAATLPSIDHE